MTWKPWWATARCGTDAAYQRHRYRRAHGHPAELTDELCREAHAREMRFRRQQLRRQGWTWNSAAGRYVPPGVASTEEKP